MSAQLNTATLAQLTDIISRIFIKKQENLDNLFVGSGLAIQESIPEGTSQFRRIAEFIDVDQYTDTKDEGAAGVKAKVQYGYENDLQIKREGKDISITVEMRKQGKHQQMIREITSLTGACANRMDLDLSHRFTFGTSTSYTDKSGKSVDIATGDTLSLFNTAHTLTGSATTYRNRLAGNPQFSKGSLENMKKLAVEETFNNLGEKTAMDFDIIWCTDDENTNNSIDELINSTADVTSANAGTFNVYKGSMKKVRLPRIATTATGAVDTTKAKYWGIASSANTQLFLGISEAPFLKTPTDGNNGEDFSTENWNFMTRCAYGITVVSARWIKMSSGDGVA